jgi:hypothetical protein
MRCYIEYIGVIDNNDNCHYIPFKEGVNVITGRSSTGKSAIIEIFDYCAGSSQNTVPVGVITENSYLYFVVFLKNDSRLVVGRLQEGGKWSGFYKLETETFDVVNLCKDYFKKEYFIPINDFKDELGRFCGLNITDTDENKEDVIYRGKKKGRPSFRNMVSFMFQHQNLIANKHTIFYRFDQKEKQERIIDEFKIFAGFVDQQYYVLCQKLNEKKKEIEIYNQTTDRIEKEKKQRVTILDELRNDYYNISGKRLFPDVDSEHIMSLPQQYIDELERTEVIVIDDSDGYKNSYNQLIQQKNELLAKRRKAQLELQQTDSSINYARLYASKIDDFHPVTEVIKGESECPFCHQKSGTTKDEYNKLASAINWLNEELRKSPKRIASFLPQKKALEDCIDGINEQIRKVEEELLKIQRINNELMRNKSLEEQSFKIRLQIENELEWVVEKKKNIEQDKIEALKKEIQSLGKLISGKYDVEKKLKEAEEFINNAMNEFGNQLDFEQSYKPINLHFDIKTFDLYHLTRNKERVYLRSMGSGANWLYSHICLFLAFQKFFASMGEKSTIPNILFLDQPSQVYFPSVIDFGGDFNYKELKRSENKEDEADADLQSVTRLYDRIIEVVESINEVYGFKPQIVISDHADHLPLSHGDFESYVRKRWRKANEGFIDLSIVNSSTIMD